MASQPRRPDFRRARNYYLARTSELAAPLIRLGARVVAGGPTPKESWKRGLIIGHTHIGDVLYRTPSLPYLAKAFPTCTWDYLAAPASARVLAGNHFVSRVLDIVSGENSWNLAQGGYAELREADYDVALCTNSLRSYPDLTLAVALGIPNRVGYADRGLSGLLTHPIELKRPQPFPAYFREMVKQLAGLRSEWSLTPLLTISARDHSVAQAFLGDYANEGTPVIACCPTTRQAHGSWPDSFFLKVINEVAERLPVRVVLCGAADERSSVESAAAYISASHRVMAGELDILPFAALLSRCDLVFSQDSAPRHLGNAVDTPVCFLRNLAVDAVESGKYCDTEEDLAPKRGRVPSAEVAAAREKLSPADAASRIVERLHRATAT